MRAAPAMSLTADWAAGALFRLLFAVSVLFLVLPVIVSVVLSLPTTGSMLLGALKTQDVNLAATFLLFVATLTVIGMLISDLALAALDPRIRFGASSEK